MTVALAEFLEGVAVGFGVGVALDGTFAAAATAADAIFEAIPAVRYIFLFSLPHRSVSQ